MGPATPIWDEESGVPVSDPPLRINQEPSPQKQQNHYNGWRRVVINFTPAWFTVNMGTGITSILLHNLPYNAIWLYWISVAIFIINIILFLVFLAISVLRYTLFRGMWTVTIKHPAQCLFLGTFPIGLATIINMIVYVCVPAWGGWAITLAWALWWFDTVCALVMNLYLPFVIISHHKTTLDTLTATLLLPVIGTVVAAGTGSIVADVLPNDQHAIWTIIISYILWGCGLPISMFILVIYFQRLMIYRIPLREVIVSVFLPIGPPGYGAFVVIQLGKDAVKVFEPNKFIPAAPFAGQVLYTVGIMMALIMWGFGLLWLFFAVAAISRQRFPFNLGWWGFTFPLGVYTVATTALGKELPSTFFKNLGTALSLVVALLWIVVSIGTIRHAWLGEFTQAPIIPEWEANKLAHKERPSQD